jgi:polysaccharide deacetylase 2 family uncharacterized protein YibQ
MSQTPSPGRNQSLRLPACLFLFCLIGLPGTAASNDTGIGTDPANKRGVAIAIIIDDMGHNLSRGKRAINLPGDLTYAVLPHTVHSHELAEEAHRRGKQVILHLPMDNLTGFPIGPDGLSRNLSRNELVLTLARAFSQVPHAQGINNHMGSYLTQLEQPMDWLMEEIKRRKLFFVDSRTTHKTVAQRIATEKNILSSRRDIFLDNQPEALAIDSAFRQLLTVARRKGTAIGIAHPYAATLDYLERELPLLAGKDVRLLPASALISRQHTMELALMIRPIP